MKSKVLLIHPQVTASVRNIPFLKNQINSLISLYWNFFTPQQLEGFVFSERHVDIDSRCGVFLCSEQHKPNPTPSIVLLGLEEIAKADIQNPVA